MSIQEKLIEFSRATGGDPRSYEEWAGLRRQLLTEEFTEFLEAIDSRDPLRIAQEGADLTYVVAGTMVRPGIDLDTAVAEVHRANMSKVGKDGRFEVRDDGKILKGTSYRPPDMTVAIKGQHQPGTTTVYLAGPMTALPDWNFPAFHAAASQVRGAGYAVLNPAEHGLDETSWATCMRRGLRDMLTADIVVVLPGWERSRGATLETYVARVLGILVYELDVFLNRASVTS